MIIMMLVVLNIVSKARIVLVYLFHESVFFCLILCLSLECLQFLIFEAVLYYPCTLLVCIPLYGLIQLFF